MRRQDMKLCIDVQDNAMEESFLTNGDVFIKDNVAINSTGIAMRDNPKTFTLLYDELEMGDIIGRGASSVVIHGIHAPTGTPLALKVINLFDRSKREQLIREIVTLYDAECPNLIRFYGAFYRDGAITIALEYMYVYYTILNIHPTRYSHLIHTYIYTFIYRNGGSLANVLSQVGPIPEYALANIAYQILWGLAYLKHEKRVHRDVKPSNLLINSQGKKYAIYYMICINK